MKKLIIILIVITNIVGVSAQVPDTIINYEEFEVREKYIRSQSGCPEVAKITKQDIEFSNVPSAAHLLEKSGEVLVQRSQGGGGSPIIRGFEANKVLLVVDGVRMNNAIYRGGHLQNVITINPAILEQVDVFFGANALMYGADALGGVMYFKTKKPELATDNNLRINIGGLTRYSTALDEKTANLSLNIGLKKLASLTNFTYSDFGNLRTGKNFDEKYGNWGKRLFYVERINNKDSIVKNDDISLQIGTAYKQYDVMQKFLFAQNEYLTHTLNFQWSNSTDIPRYDRLNEVLKTGLPRQDEWYYGPQRRTMIAYHLDYNRSMRLADKIQMVTAWQDIEESRFTRNFGSSNRAQRIENIKVLSGNLDVLKVINKNTLRYGFEFQSNDINSTATSFNVKTLAVTPTDTRYPDGGSSMTTAAVYLTNEHRFSSTTTLHTGVRYNATSLNATFIDKTFFPLPFSDINQQTNALVGNISMRMRFANGINLSPTLSSAYRAPNVDDLAKVFESVAGRLIVPNPDLKSEKTYNVELLIEKTFRNKLSFQAVPYFTRYFDALTVAPFRFEGKDTLTYKGVKSAIFTTTNNGKANIYGFSIRTKYDFVKNFSLKGNLNYTVGRVLENNNTTTPLDHIPPMYGKVSLDFVNKKWQSSLYFLFNGEKKSSDYRLKTEDNEVYSADPINGYTPAWQTWNIAATYNFTPTFHLQIGIENILDKHYRVFASGVSGAGRNFSITLRGGL